MKNAISIPSLSRARRQSNDETYQPTYRESTYQRPIFQRLTPLSRFLLVLAAVGVLTGAVLLISRLLGMRNGTELLSERLYGRSAAAATAAPMPTISIVFLDHPDTEASAEAEAAVAAQASQAAQPTPAPQPTTNPNRAPWADQLVKQTDGTYAAPPAVVATIVSDLSGYYLIQRNLPLDQYMAMREQILTTYFTGAALAEMRRQEALRDLYGMNLAGRLTIEVRNFSADGLTAKAGVITRDWVSDVYDVANKQLVAQGRVKKDALTVMTIVFDKASGHWKFSAVEETVELQS